MNATTPLSAPELCEALRHGDAVDTSRLDRILSLDAVHGLLEVQAGTRWPTIAAELRPGDARANVRTTMPTVGESICRNAAGPDGKPAVSHVASLTLAMPDGELRRVNRRRDPELFALVVGGQGLFGVLYSVTLRIASLAQAVEQARRPDELTLRPSCRARHALELLLPPEAVEPFMRETDERCNDWRIPLQGVSVRTTEPEHDTYLRWARRDYAEVRLAFAEPDDIGGSVRGTQVRRELIDAAIAVGGSFQIASTRDATPAQLRTCYPQLGRFLAEKRRFDPSERLSNDWYLHQRRLAAGEHCPVRWAN